MDFHNQLKGHVKSIYQYDEKQPFHTRSPFLQVIYLKKTDKTTLYMSWPLTSNHNSKLPVFGTLIIFFYTTIK